MKTEHREGGPGFTGKCYWFVHNRLVSSRAEADRQHGAGPGEWLSYQVSGRGSSRWVSGDTFSEHRENTGVRSTQGNKHTEWLRIFTQGN